MIQLRPITLVDVHAFKTTRLAALRDTPTAFGSTYEKESQLTDADWLARVRQWNGERSLACLAWDRETPCGIVAAFLDQQQADKAHLVSMWVAPTHRHRGAGRSLVSFVIEWGRQQQAGSLLLMVTSNNDPAMKFYNSLGFELTGQTAPYPNDPALFELEMKRVLTPASSAP